MSKVNKNQCKIRYVNDGAIDPGGERVRSLTGSTTSVPPLRRVGKMSAPIEHSVIEKL